MGTLSSDSIFNSPFGLQWNSGRSKLNINQFIMSELHIQMPLGPFGSKIIIYDWSTWYEK